MRQQENQLNDMDNNDRKRDQTTSLDATDQHKSPVKGRINNDPLPLPTTQVNFKVISSSSLVGFFGFVVVLSVSAS